MADNKINVGGRLHSIATGNILAGADEILDENKGKKQSEVNTDIDNALADRYTKDETYDKNQLNSLITTPDVQYVSVVATEQTTVITDILPSIGVANTIYRVGKWNGTQYNTVVYSEYAWDGSAYVLLDVKEYGIDDEPTAESNNLVKSGGVFAKINQLKENVTDLIGEEYIPTYNVINGSYIDNNGVLSSNSSFKKTSAFFVQKGGTITFVGKANPYIACIAKTDENESSYVVLKVGETVTLTKTYTATVDEDCYIVISYYDLTSIVVITSGTITQLQEQVGTIEGDVTALNRKLGYYVCETERNIAEKVVTDTTGYVLSNGGSMKVKMTNVNTAGNATLNINSTGAKPLYYGGERASANNSWEAGETVEVYYDGTNYYANSVAGGSGSGDGAFDISAKTGQNYETLIAALVAANTILSASKKKGGMSIKFIRPIPATYNVVKTEGLTEQPTGIELQNASTVVSGTYNASQLSDFTTLPATIGDASAITYYVAVSETVEEVTTTTYITWVITKSTNDSQEYVQYRLMSTAWSTVVGDWQGVDNEPTTGSNNLVKSGGVYPWTCVINAGLYREPATFQNLAEALSVIPPKARRGKALLYYLDNLANLNVFIYVSSSTSPENWNNTSYWKRILSEKDAKDLFELKNNKTTVISEDSTDEQFPSAKAAYTYVKSLNNIITPINSEFKKLKTVAEFNNSIGTSDSIVLQNEGDFIEIEILNVASSTELNAGKFGLATYAAGYVSISVTANHVFVRADDRTWICNSVAHNGGNSFTLKVAYEEGHINTYINGTLISSYNELKKITLKRWGVYTSGSDFYWKGAIGTIVINRTTYDNILYIPGWNSDTVSCYTQHGFLTEEQYNVLQDIILNNRSKIHIIPSSESVLVFFNIHKDFYGCLDIQHKVNNSVTGESDTNYYEDMWRVVNNGVFKYDGEQFITIGKNLLVNAENEFAIKFSGMDYYTGGYHGYEKIIPSNGDYIKFYVDGKAFTIDELISAGEQDCDAFCYREVTSIFARYTFDSNMPVIAKHYKETSFDKGFKVKNYIKFDLSVVSNLAIQNAFFGLVCVHKDFAKIVTSDDGTEYIGNNPTTSAVLANPLNIYSKLAEYRNDEFSCSVDSKLLGSNIDNISDDYTNILIMDRENDLKYYSYLPTNINLQNNDFFATECIVTYNIK